MKIDASRHTNWQRGRLGEGEEEWHCCLLIWMMYSRPQNVRAGSGRKRERERKTERQRELWPSSYAVAAAVELSDTLTAWVSALNECPNWLTVWRRFSLLLLHPLSPRPLTGHAVRVIVRDIKWIVVYSSRSVPHMNLRTLTHTCWQIAHVYFKAFKCAPRFMQH